MKTNDIERKRHHYIGQQPNSSKQTQPSFGSTNFRRKTFKKQNAILSMPDLIPL